MVVPLLVIGADIGVYRLECLCHLRVKNGDILILFVFIHLLDGILQWETSLSHYLLQFIW